MALREEFEQTGQWLFRWRSYLPLLMLALVVLGLHHCKSPGDGHSLDLLWGWACFALSLVGLGIRVATVGSAPKGTSGRNLTTQVAEYLNTTGMYSILRHPLYLGNCLMGLGVILIAQRYWLVLVYGLAFCLYYERIMFAEEEFLRRKFGHPYEAWALRTPAFIPRLRQWKRPAFRFSWRWAVRREHTSFFGLVGTFTGLEVLSQFMATGRWVIDPVWRTLLLVSTALYAILRWLSKRTTLLSDFAH